MCRVKTEEKAVSYSYKNALQVQASEYSNSQVPVIGVGLVLSSFGIPW
jgi:hypothetical protein